MSPSKETTGNVVNLPTAALPRYDRPLGMVARPYCLGLDRVVREAWRAVCAARTSASQVPNDEDTQDYYRRTVGAMGKLSREIREVSPEHEVRGTAFVAIGFARETQEYALAAGFSTLGQ